MLKALLLGGGMAVFAAAQARAGTITCSSESGAACQVGRAGATCSLFRGGLEHSFIIDTDVKQMQRSHGAVLEPIPSAFTVQHFTRCGRDRSDSYCG